MVPDYPHLSELQLLDLRIRDAPDEFLSSTGDDVQGPETLLRISARVDEEPLWILLLYL